MKLLLILLLLSLSSLSLSNADAVVRDTSGQALRRGAAYRVLPVFRGRGGGLDLHGRNNETCPLFVLQTSNELDGGYPVTFLPVNAGDEVVRLSTDFNVYFVVDTICVRSTVWQLSDVEGVKRRRYVMDGGMSGNPGPGTVSNWFKIERYGDGGDYKLVFCPSVCSYCKVLCGDVGVFVEGGKRWLGLNGDPLPVMFKRVESKVQ